MLSVYQITHSDTGKRVEFTLDAANISDLHSSSKIATGEVNNGARMYTFSEFIESESSLLLTHADDSSRLWHERFGHLNYRYMQQLSKNEMVEGLPNISFSKGVCEGCVLGKHPREKFDTGKTHRASSPLDLIHSDLRGLFLILPSTKQGMCLHLLMISHGILGCIFSGPNLKFLLTLNISKH